MKNSTMKYQTSVEKDLTYVTKNNIYIHDIL